MQLPAQFAHVIDPHRQAAAAHGLDVLGGQPREAGVRQIGLRHLAEHVAGTRAGDDQRAEVCGHILDGNRAVGGQALAQQIHIVGGSNGGADDVEMVFAQTRDGELAPQLSIICERIG